MNKIKLSIMSILIIIIISLMIYLVYFINKYDSETPYHNCTFNTPYYLLDTFDNEILCAGYNKIIIDEVRLDGLKQNVYVIYYNGALNNTNNKSGIYLNDKRILKGASNNYKNKINVFDNMLFVRPYNNFNLFVYNSSGKKIYDFKNALETTYIKDPSLDSSISINSNLSINHIEKETFDVDFKTIKFNSTSECQIGQLYQGSKFEIKYSNSKFSNPKFVSFTQC